MKSGETVAEALRFAGGLAAEAGGGTLTLRHRDASGVASGQDVAISQAGKVALSRGDLLSAPVRRERTGPVVELSGWVRIPGIYARTAGMRISDLLKREEQVLPDSYRARGEVLHTATDGATRFQSFDVDKALAGDAAHNLLLEDRDRVELFRLEDLRLVEFVTVLGPVARPGTFRFHQGMRASDLLFRAGVPKKSADRLVGELARSKEGKPSEVIRLDLARLLSTQTGSPVTLLDDAVNPRIQADDQLSLFEKPDFKVHRTIRISGQVLRPGTYTLDSDKPTLRTLMQRAGGLTPEAMLKASVFLRRMGQSDKALEQAAEASGVGAKDPTAKGINDVLERLNETKRQLTTGALLKSPIMHNLANGSISRMVVNFEQAMKGDAQADLELLDGDEIIIPRATEAAYVVGETASPFATYRVAKGMKVKPWVKTSLAPGSRVVSDYLAAAGVQKDLDKLGFNTVGYGCTTCIGNSGPLPEPISDAITKGDIVACSVLSGNRNFEGRVNPHVKANYLASPPLVVAYALAGSMRINLSKDPIGTDKAGKPVFLKDIWPSNQEISAMLKKAIKTTMFKTQYGTVFEGDAS